MKPKKGLSPDTLTRLSVVNIVKGKDPLFGLSLIRASTTPDKFQDLLNQLEGFPNKLTGILQNKCKRSLGQLDSANLIPIELEAEITWAKIVLLRSHETVSEFIAIREGYSKAIFNSDYVTATELLDKLQESFGESVWLIKNRISLLQISEGLDHQKDFTNEIKQSLETNTLIGFLTHWISVRNEDGTSYGWFKSRVTDIINRNVGKAEDGFEEYLKYHLLDEQPVDVEKFINVVRMDYSRSIVDLYESFLSFLQIALFNDDLRPKVLRTCKSLGNKISDHRLDTLLKIVSNRQFPVDGFYNDEATTLFLKGDFEGSFNTSLVKMEKMGCSPKGLAIAAKAKAMSFSSQKSEEWSEFDSAVQLRSRIIEDLSHVYVHGQAASKRQVGWLKKTSVNLGTLGWPKLLRLLVLQESKMFYRATMENSITALGVGLIDSSCLPFFKGEVQKKTISQLVARSLDLDAGTILDISRFNGEPVEQVTGYLPEEFLLANSIICFDSERYKESIKASTKLSSSNIGYYRRLGIGNLCYGMFELGQTKKACKLCVESFLEEPEVLQYLPIKVLCDSINPGTDSWDEIASLIDFPILLDIYTEKLGGAKDVERRFAYEDFLMNRRITFPSDLHNTSEEIDTKKVVYYLKNLCVESNMDMSTSFNGGSKDVLNERLKICRVLVEIDSDSSQDYEDEIKRIIRQQAISSMRVEVDQSRIYVDTNRIRNWAKKELHEGYHRYLDYLRFGLAPSGIAKKSKNRTSSGLMAVPDNEVSSLLRQLIEEIRDAYLGPDYGLDRFLSTRIRHGHLEKYLRKPLQEHKLITKRAYKNGPYKSNGYIRSKILDYSKPSLTAKVDGAASKFSQSYDNLILEIASNWLQINGPGKPEGLFDFTITEQDVVNVAESIGLETTLEEFIELVIKFLESTLIFHLASVREKLNVNGKPNAKQFLNNFQENLSNLSEVVDMTELKGEINKARTEIQRQFEKVMEWFVPPSTGDSQPFTIEQAVRVAEVIVKEGGAKFEVEIEMCNESKTLTIHGTLPIFIDIFATLFDNVVQRSAILKPSALVTVKSEQLSDDLQVLHIAVSNEHLLHEQVNTINVELDRKRQLLENGNYREYLATEGNSGLFKVHKPISELRAIGFDYKPKFEFKLGKKQFVAKLSIPFRVFSLEIEETEDA